ELRHGGRLMASVSIMVVDVRGFTAYSTGLPPKEVMQNLNTMLDTLVPIIFEYDGTIDKYTGDGILAVFGSPHPDPDHIRKAVDAGLAMQSAMTTLQVPFEIGIGIHSGEVVHGFLGSAERLEYTVIGDTVNKASRHCDGARPGDVLVSEAIYTAIQPFVKAELETIPSKYPQREPDIDAYRIIGWRRRRK
ncbi:MAG: adenylate/guanylate cyclase domain-containing protein, partial [Aggregatilineales bacterium]